MSFGCQNIFTDQFTGLIMFIVCDLNTKLKYDMKIRHCIDNDFQMMIILLIDFGPICVVLEYSKHADAETLMLYTSETPQRRHIRLTS